MSALLRRVEGFVADHHLLRPKQRLLVAVSGGLDSMALLDLLHHLRSRCGWRLLVAHFNHQLRGDASDADEAFVKAESARLGLSCLAGRGDVSAFAKQSKLSLEMAARQLRHEFLAETARRLRSPAVALAHHADDQAELFFLRVLRGTGGAGLAGMQPCSRSPVDPSIQLVRPLLKVTRDELAVYAKRRALRFREDASNTSLDFLRNKIRRRLLPLLEGEFQPGLRAVTARVMEIVGTEADFVHQAAEAWLKSRRRTPFERLHPAVGRETLRGQLLRLGVTPDFELIEHLRLRPGCAMCASPDVAVILEKSGLVRAFDPAAPSFDPTELGVALRGTRGHVRFAKCSIDWELETARRATVLPRSRPGTELFDADRVGEGITLRHWRAGDRFRPIGMNSPMKLQDFFVNARVPRIERHHRVVAVASNGGIFWVEGMRIGDGFKLDKGTTRRLKWQWQRDKASVAREPGS